MQWLAQAPANIALIKYMGKKDSSLNIPLNPSLSYTLNHLLSNVVLETIAGKKDYWEPLYIPGASDFSLTTSSQERYLAHLKKIKEFLNFNGAFVVRSSNNFPTGSGLASSASSFAALTKAAVQAICELQEKPCLPIEEQARLSQLGSGSSCRSFFSPWVLWDEHQVGPIELPYPELIHQVVLISHEEKKISSSEAHQRVQTSPFYAMRAKNASDHLLGLLDALQKKQWHTAFEITWREFQQMHQLFTTCAQPFSYITEQSQALLKVVQDLWKHKQDGPLVTMDAGPNIHLLYRLDQQNLAQEFKQRELVGNYDVL